LCVAFSLLLLTFYIIGKRVRYIKACSLEKTKKKKKRKKK